MNIIDKATAFILASTHEIKTRLELNHSFTHAVPINHTLSRYKLKKLPCPVHFSHSLLATTSRVWYNAPNVEIYEDKLGMAIGSGPAHKNPVEKRSSND